MARPDYAPPGWRMDQTEAVIRETVLELGPDVVCFQELPGLVPFIETHGMAPANAKGQTGDLATLVRLDWMPKVTARAEGPAVVADLGDISVANVHLPSGKGAGRERLSAARMLAGEKVALIGDTNTRTKEEEDFAKLGLTGPRPPEPTWNGRTNQFRISEREFTAYFTRCFVGQGLEITQQTVLTEVVEDTFHISDHYALFVRIKRNDPK